MLDCGYLCLLQQLSVSAVNYLLRPHFWGVLQALSDNAVDISAKIDHNLMWDVNSLTESYPEFILNSSFTLIEASGADHLRGDLQFPALRALQMLIYQTDKITYTLKSLLLHDFKAESSPEKEQDYDKENSFCILMELYLRKAQNNHVANVFTRIVHRLSLLVNDSSLPLLDFFLVDDMLTFRRTAVVHFIHWFIKNSSVDLHLRQLLIRANIIYLIESAISAENIYPLDPSDRTASLYRQEVLSWAKEVFKTTYKVINLPRLKYDA
ncbi:hypothetical protein VKT23_011653 [Stygiomarasmius scandens]|uniref:Ubiquitin conjugation factor E4 core domain-containing protein n=1 Tax=Marasmiellus scandens TaxID=2682957 RepID=A0ABR1J7Q0_9AGAR